MIKNRKTVKGKLGKTRPKDTDFAGIARKQNRKKKTTTKTVKSNRPTSSKVKTNRAVLKEKVKLAEKGLGRPNQAFLGGMGKQTPKPKTKKTKRVIDRAVRRAEPTKKAKVRKAMDNIAIGDQYGRPFGLKAGGKASKYRMKGGGKTSKYMAKGGKTSKYMARGGRAK